MMETYEIERIKQLEEAEAQAYARRQKAEDLINELIVGELVFKGTTYDSKIFFQLRQTFQEYEAAEERCCITTDRLSEYHQNVRDWGSLPLIESEVSK